MKIYDRKHTSLTLRKTTAENGNFLEKNIKLTTQKGVLLFPFAYNTEEVANVVKYLYGTQFYPRNIVNVLFPKKILFVHKEFGISVNKRERLDMVAKVGEILQYLPKLLKKPKSLLTNDMNTLLDYSFVINAVLPYGDDPLVKKLAYTKKVISLVPEIMYHILFNYQESVNSDDEVSLDNMNDLFLESNYPQILTKHLKITTENGISNGFLNKNFKSAIVTYKLRAKTSLPLQYYTRERNIKMEHLKNDDMIKDFSVIQMIYDMYVSYFTKKPSEITEINHMLTKDIKFYLYNDQYGFLIDFYELAEIRKRKPLMFLRRLIVLTNTLFGINANTISQDILNEVINLKDEEDNVEEEKLSEETIETSKEEDDEDDFFERNKSNFINQLRRSGVSKVIKLLPQKKKTITSVGITKPISMTQINNFIDLVESDEIENEVSTTNDISIPDFEAPTATQTSILDTDEVEESIDGLEENIDTTNHFFPTDDKASLRRKELLEEKHKAVVLPNGKTIQEEKDSLPEKVIIKKYNKDNNYIIDKSLNNSKMKDWSKTYDNEVMEADILQAFDSFNSPNSRYPLIITDYKMEDTSDNRNNKRTFTVTMESVRNMKKNPKTTVTIDIPWPDNDGYYFIGGNTYLLKKQIVFKPVVKIKPDEVLISTSRSKTKINRRKSGHTSKESFGFNKLFSDILLNNENLSIVNGNTFLINKNTDYIKPLELDNLSKLFVSITVEKRYIFNFDLQQFDDLLELKETKCLLLKPELNIINDKDKLETISNNFDRKKYLPYVYDKKEKTIYIVENSNLNQRYLPAFFTIFNQIFKEKEIVNTTLSKIKTTNLVFNTINYKKINIPLIIYLSYIFGFKHVLQRTKINWRFSEKKENINDSFIKFQNGYFYYSKEFKTQLLLAGLNALDTDEILFEDLDKDYVYSIYIKKVTGNENTLKTWLNSVDSLLDPITIELLQKMNIPSDFLGLFLYCSDLLATNNYTLRNDVNVLRVRGNETVYFILYKRLHEEYDLNKGRTGKLTLAQNAISDLLVSEQIMDVQEVLSPVNEVKAMSLCTKKGPMGENLAEGFNMEARSYGKNMIGTFGVGNVDNGSVGVIQHLTMNPDLTDVRGFINEPSDLKKEDNNRFVPIHELTSPGYNSDHPNRRTFTGGQMKHIIETDNLQLPPIRSGVEHNFSEYVSDKFVFKAKQDGVVTEITDTQIFVTYKDGTSEAISLETTYNKSSDFYLKTNLISNVKKGQKFKRFDALTYHDKFFKEEFGQLVYTDGSMETVALNEGFYTEDDSSMISYNTAMKTTSPITKTVEVSMKKSDLLVSIAKIGDDVKINDVITTFRRDVGEDSDSDLLSELGINTDDIESEMFSLIANTKKSTYTGKITDIKLYWTVNPEEFSPSIYKLIKGYQNELNRQAKLEETITKKPSKKRLNMEITKPNHGILMKQPVDPDGSLVIQFYITHDSILNVGDKISIPPSSKSIIQRVAQDNMYTESGDYVGLFFSFLSICNRLVSSPLQLGFLGRIIQKRTHALVDSYFSEKPMKEDYFQTEEENYSTFQDELLSSNIRLEIIMEMFNLIQSKQILNYKDKIKIEYNSKLNEIKMRPLVEDEEILSLINEFNNSIIYYSNVTNRHLVPFTNKEKEDLNYYLTSFLDFGDLMILSNFHSEILPRIEKLYEKSKLETECLIFGIKDQTDVFGFKKYFINPLEIVLKLDEEYESIILPKGSPLIKLNPLDNYVYLK